MNATHEPYNEMQAAISSYTTAQVAPSDGIGFSNASLINMACRSDGRLLQPSAPARAIDASFALSGGPQPRVRARLPRREVLDPPVARRRHAAQPRGRKLDGRLLSYLIAYMICQLPGLPAAIALDRSTSFGSL